MNEDRTVDGVPTDVVSLVALACCGMVVAGSGRSLLGAAALAAAGVLCLTQARRLSARHRGGAEDDVWRPFTRAAVCFGVGLVLAAGVGAATSQDLLDPGWAGLGFGVAAVGGCSQIYQGLCHWNRYRAVDSDMGDWINGSCAVLAVVAAGGLLIRVTHAPMDGWSDVQSSLWLAHVGALLVLCGAAGTVSALGGMERDWRVLGVTIALGVALIAELAAGFSGDVGMVRTTTRVIWILLIAVLGVASMMQPAPISARPPGSQSPTIGALVVLAASTVVLGFDGLQGMGHLSTTVLAGAAALGSGARLIHLVGSLAGLAQSQQEARTDDLTGIANRRAVYAALSLAALDRRDAALLVIDLDRFKEINDHHGHAVGDEVLRAISRRLQAILPSHGLIGRLGGDEFAVLLTGADAARASELGWRVVAVCAEPVETGSARMTLGASVGVATTELGGHGEGELMRRADTAMYVAKRAGGGISTYDVNADLRMRQEHDRLEELRVVLDPDASASERQQIVVHYQPQVDMASGAVVGAEALVRWRHPQLGVLPPSAFLDLVERHGLMVDLTATVLQQATAQAVRWRQSGHAVRVAVNLSTSVLGHPDLLAMVDQVAAAGVEPSCLTLEITETTLMSDPDLALDVTRAIASRGVGISIDDYGTGYSSLAYLNDLPAAELKLDRSFTSRLTADPRTASIVAGTIDLAHGLGLRMVAEGVEDDETLAALRALGCDESQGYLHARPMPADHFFTWLQRHDCPSDSGRAI